MAPAEEAHHWTYPDPDKLGPEHLVALCRGCHEIITTLRRQLRRGASRFEVVATINRTIRIMLYTIKIDGTSPIIMHNGTAGLDGRSPISREIATIAAKKGSNRTEADDDRLRELGCQRSLWLDESGTPAIPATALRAAIESAARKRKQGPQARGGMVVIETAFEYNIERYGDTIEELGRRSPVQHPRRRPAQPHSAHARQVRSPLELPLHPRYRHRAGRS